jgi:hypothetical protein
VHSDLSRPVTGVNRRDRNGCKVVAGLAELHSAEAFAMLGDLRRCMAAVGAAEQRFAAVGPRDPAAALFCPSHHARLVGSCWLFLNRPDKALPVLDNARRHIAARRKSTAVVLGNLALASIKRRNIDAATAHLNQAIDVIEQTRGGGGLNLAFTAARQLRPWRHESPVQDVHDRLLAL